MPHLQAEVRAGGGCSPPLGSACWSRGYSICRAPHTHPLQNSSLDRPVLGALRGVLLDHRGAGRLPGRDRPLDLAGPGDSSARRPGNRDAAAGARRGPGCRPRARGRADVAATPPRRGHRRAAGAGWGPVPRLRGSPYRAGDRHRRRRARGQRDSPGPPAVLFLRMARPRRCRTVRAGVAAVGGDGRVHLRAIHARGVAVGPPLVAGARPCASRPRWRKHCTLVRPVAKPRIDVRRRCRSIGSWPPARPACRA